MVLKSPSVLCRSVTMRLKKLKPLSVWRFNNGCRERLICAVWTGRVVLVDVDFNIHQNHQPPIVFGARCVSRSPMKCLKHVLKLHVQYLPKYSYTRYIHPLLARTRSPKYNKAQSKRKANTSKHRRHLSLV